MKTDKPMTTDEVNRQIFAFEVSVKDAPWPPSIVNHVSAGKAKSDYLRDVRESWQDVKFTEIRCRKIGKPFSSDQFIRNAAYRGMPDVRCGQRVRVGKGTGSIIGHNSSANFNVLFDADSPDYAGLTLNVHPSEVAACLDEDEQEGKDAKS